MAVSFHCCGLLCRRFRLSLLLGSRLFSHLLLLLLLMSFSFGLHLLLLLLIEELLLIFRLSLGLDLHLMQLSLRVRITGIGLLHQALNVSGTSILLLLLHLEVLHLLGGGKLLLLKHLLVLDGGRIFLSSHLILLLVTFRGILHEVCALRSVNHGIAGSVRHVFLAWRDVLALVAVVELLALKES